MHEAIRNPMMAGLALAGASVIAVSPVAPPPPDIQVPAVYSGTVQLTTTYQELLANSLANAGDLLDLALNPPAPILQQILENQATNIGAIIAGLQLAGQDTLALLTGLPAVVQDAFDALAAGDLVGATNILLEAAIQPVFIVTEDILPPIQATGVAMLLNLVNVVATLTDPENLESAFFALVDPVNSTILATAQAIQDVIDGNPDTLTALVQAPATILDGFLNGFGATGGAPNAGLLSACNPSCGPIGFALALRQAIAGALTETAETVATPLAVSEVPGPADKTFTLDAKAGAGDTQVVDTNTGALESDGTEGATAPDAGQESEDVDGQGAINAGSTAEDQSGNDADDTHGVVVKDGNKATPGHLGNGSSSSTEGPKTPLSGVRDSLNATVGQIRNGISNALGGRDKSDADADTAKSPTSEGGEE